MLNLKDKLNEIIGRTLSECLSNTPTRPAYKNKPNPLAEMFLSRILNERVSPVVWHFCWFDAISAILRKNEFRLTRSNIDREEHPGVTGYTERSPYYLCTTRSKSSAEGYSRLVSNDNREGYARIQLDGDALNNVCRGKASDYFGTRSDTELMGKRAINKRAENGNLPSVSNYREISSLIDNEKEDTVWYKAATLPNANKYIQRVDILIPTKESMKENETLCYVLKRNAERLGVPIFFYSDISEFDKQSDKIFNPQTPPSLSRS